MAICKGFNTVFQNIPLVVKSIKTSFVYFDGSQDVIRGLEGTESAGSGFGRFEDGQKLIVSNFLFPWP